MLFISIKKMKTALPDFKKTNPLQQGIVIMLLITLMTLVCWLFQLKSMFAWNLILSPLFLFCFYNPVIGAFQQKLLQYTGFSVLMFILLAMYIYISGNFVSDFSYKQSDELHIMTALVVLFYLLLNLLCLLFRGILYMLEQIDN